MSKFTDMLTEAREKKKMTKVDVANLFNWTPMYYGRYENGYIIPRSKNIELFARFIGITPKKLKEIIEEEASSDENGE